MIAACLGSQNLVLDVSSKRQNRPGQWAELHARINNPVWTCIPSNVLFLDSGQLLLGTQPTESRALLGPRPSEVMNCYFEISWVLYI